MDDRQSGIAPWEEVLEELRRLRRDITRGDEELWEAVEDLHDAVLEGTESPEPARKGPASSTRLDPREYRRLKRRLWRFVEDRIPGSSRIAVVSRGDDDLLDLLDMKTEHFPREAGGAYAGYYPPDGTSMIAHLEWVRALGAEFLLFPATASWWFESFPTFSSYLRRHYPVVAESDGVAVLFGLRGGTGAREGSARQIDTVVESWAEDLGRGCSILDWDTGLDLESRFPASSVFSPPENGGSLPYLDSTVDLVALTGDDPHRLSEARRVAGLSIIRLTEPGHGPDQEGSDLEARPDSQEVVEHLEGPPRGLPSVTVVVPTYNGIVHLEPCLRALESTLPPSFEGEVLVVDDGSGRETVEGLAQWEDALDWLRVVRNPRNLGFIGSCNHGAKEAKGEVLVFLNDDTVPLHGWLPALVGTFSARPDAGAVGGRLVYPDGRLQEAGSVVFRDGSGANLGRGDFDVDGPLYRFMRRVHYCSGALLATPRRLFESIGGFDTRYLPAYYEDTDYCFSVRDRGLSVYYQPESTVVHMEGASSGTDPATGVKRHQARNQKSFYRRWRTSLKNHPEPPSTYSSLTWHRLALAGDGP
ncbi:MAG: glycosyltransferase family 2 protein [Gemmatimonadetes bacterium]|nr:glycosyltransferase family 2 protein [Gemmatimonadota bacterium]